MLPYAIRHCSNEKTAVYIPSVCVQVDGTLICAHTPPSQSDSAR